LAEARFFLSAARTNPAIAGAIVGIDLRDPDSTSALLDALGSDPKLLGGRMIEPQEAGVGILSTPAARECIRRLGERGLRFDLLVRSGNPGQLREACELMEWVTINTTTTVIGDHLLKPTEVAAGRPTAEWTQALTTLAQFPSFFLKISGMPGEVPVGTPPEQYFQFYDTALELFGAERLMFGSDHPVSYAHQAAVDGVLAWLTARGLARSPVAQQIFALTGRRAYGV
jgi:L-fuconolactonase